MTTPTAEPYDAPESPASGETRCYQLTPDLLENERETLEMYNAYSLPDLLLCAERSFASVFTLLGAVESEATIPGQTLNDLGNLMRFPLDMLSKVQEVYSHMQLVHLQRAE